MSKPVKIHHKMQRWEHWKDSYCVHIFLFLLLEAKQSATSYKGVRIARGQVVAAGRGFISKETGISKGNVRGAVKRMVASGELSYEVFEPKPGDRFTVITITNYEEHQREIEREPTTYEKRMAEAKSKPYSAPFERWWKVYGKGGKGAAWFGWQEVTGKPPIDELIQKTIEYVEYCKSLNRPLMDGQGWLRQRYFDSDWTHESQKTKHETPAPAQSEWATILAAKFGRVLSADEERVWTGEICRRFKTKMDGKTSEEIDRLLCRVLRSLDGEGIIPRADQKRSMAPYNAADLECWVRSYLRYYD